jgi:hypothetical protein
LIDAILELDHRFVIGCFDELPMMHLLPLPIACSLQDIPLLAEATVSQLLPQLQGEGGAKEKAELLSARVVTNRAFQRMGEWEGK